MRIPRIFLDQDMSLGQLCELDAFASGHICRVLRMKAGRALIVFNGRGGEYHALLNDADPRRAKVEINNFDAVNRESPLQIHLGIALSRGDRFEWAIQKSVELGVAKITPLECARSDRIGDTKRQNKKLEHWQKLIISACEQSGRTAIPQIVEPQNCDIWIDRVKGNSGFLLQPGAKPIGEQFVGITEPVALLNLAIGPEGGFEEKEEQGFLEAGFAAVSFGPRVLRTETAPVAVIALLQHLLGDC